MTPSILTCTRGGIRWLLSLEYLLGVPSLPSQPVLTWWVDYSRCLQRKGDVVS